jgi:hypothetical protein
MTDNADKLREPRQILDDPQAWLSALIFFREGKGYELSEEGQAMLIQLIPGFPVELIQAMIDAMKSPNRLENDSRR